MQNQPTPLRLAIVQSGRPQKEVAAAAGIREDVMSGIARGRVVPTADERAAIANAIRRPEADLWPDLSEAA